MYKKQKFEVVGKISEVNLNELFNEREENIDKKKLKRIVSIALSAAVFAMLNDAVFAAEVASSTAKYKAPTQLKALLEFVEWLVELLRLITSSIAGLICTFAGWKWATAIESNGQEAAKKILKNAFVGGIIVWTGTTIADFFVSKMNELLL